MEHAKRRQKGALLTEENRQESAKLKTIYTKTKHGFSQAAFGDTYGIGNQAAVWQCLNASGMPISLKAAQGFAKGLNCEIADFSPRLAALAEGIAASVHPEAQEFVQVQHANVAVSAGHGAVVYEDGRKSSLSFRRDYLRGQGVSEKNAVVVDVKGHSMEPLIDDGSVLLVNRAHRQITSGLVYAFRLDGELFVKKLFKVEDGYLAQSENPDKDEYPDMPINAKTGDFEMIGRAIWMGKKL
ncbi:MAG: S24 family peptidase [Burkholderiaceae bacterium]